MECIWFRLAKSHCCCLFLRAMCGESEISFWNCSCFQKNVNSFLKNNTNEISQHGWFGSRQKIFTYSNTQIYTGELDCTHILHFTMICVDAGQPILLEASNDPFKIMLF